MLAEHETLQVLMKSRTRLSAAAWVIVWDAHAAEDIFQNVALKAMTREVSFETERALISWAFITARPTCSTMPAAQSPSAANSASTRRRNCRAKASDAPGRR